MQPVTNPATPATWEEAYDDWKHRPAPNYPYLHTSEERGFRAGWDAAIASQAEEVAQLRDQLDCTSVDWDKYKQLQRERDSAREEVERQLVFAQDHARDIAQLRAQLASQAELVAAALALKDVTGQSLVEKLSRLSAAGDAYRAARPGDPRCG